MVSPANQTRASAAGVRRHNHHATIYCFVPNPRGSILPLPWSRTDLGHISLSSRCIRHFSLPQHAPDFQPYLYTRWTGQTRLTNSQAAVHESWLLRYSLCALGFSCEKSARIDLYICQFMSNSDIRVIFCQAKVRWKLGYCAFYGIT